MPLPVISIAQMREWENATWAAGQTELNVIRRVGAAVAQQSLQLTQPGDTILILAGKGNNGQDALAARESLTDRHVLVVEVKDPASDLRLLRTAISQNPRLIIDGLFGIGLSRPLDSAWIALIEQVNQAVAEMDKVVQQNAANAEESASASEELNAQAEQTKAYVRDLVAVVGKTTVDKRKTRTTAAAIPRSLAKVALKPAPQAGPKRSRKGSGKELALVKHDAKEISPEQVIPFEDEDYGDF